MAPPFPDPLPPDLSLMTPADLPAVARLHAVCFGAEAWSERAFADLLAGTGVAGLMAPGAADPVGAILIRTVADEAEILTLCVDPAARRRGLGALLTGAAARLAAAAGAEALHLEVAADNLAAQALYLALGFRPVGRRPRYYARPGGAVDALLLACRFAEDLPDAAEPL